MIIGIFGDGSASPKLVTSSLNDTLEAHNVDAPDEDFWVCVGIRKPQQPIYNSILNWALRNGIYIAVYGTYEPKEWKPDWDTIAEYHRSDRYMLDVVDRIVAEGGGKIYALLGDQQPSVAVRRALVRALDNGLEVRDLAEAGLTYVGVSDNPLTIGSIIMANDLTLAEAGEAADNDDEESMAALTELAAQYDLDPDDYPTWVGLAEVLHPLMADTPEAETEAEEEAKPRRSGKLAPLSRDELEATAVPELRALAKQLGVEGWDKNRSAKLIDGILDAQSGGSGPDDESGDEPRPAARTIPGTLELVSDNGDILVALAAGLRAFADALDP